MPTIKEEMSALDRRNFSWYDNLSEDEQKSLSMWVLMRYASSTQSNVKEINEHYLTLVNELVNVGFNDLRHYPDLQWRLMQCAGIGSNQFHPWIKPGKRKGGDTKANKKLHGLLLERNPHWNDDEIDIAISQMDRAAIKTYLTESGLSDKEIKEYLK